MKRLSKNFLFVFFLLFAFSLSIEGQTFVSGGIYSNTAWTAANSPYVVTDTIVVFPGVTLSIEPGVIVKFDTNTVLEIREGRILAEGTSSNKISFTSNSIYPSHSSWKGIVLNGDIEPLFTSKFNNCNITYADKAICGSVFSGHLNVLNSKFENNNYGIYCSQTYNLIDSCVFLNNYFATDGLSIGTVRNTLVINNHFGFYIGGNVLFQNCIFRLNQIGVHTGSSDNVFDNCIINSNVTGLSDNLGNTTVKNCVIDSNSYVGIMMSGEDTIFNCQFRKNGIGLYSYPNNSTAKLISKNIIENNTIGAKFESSLNNFYCNKLCDNSDYDVYYNSYNGSNIDLSNNFWCSNDSVAISSRIFDGYDDISLGLVRILPVDSMQCYLNSECSAYFNLYPDNQIQHQYYAVNMALGVFPMTYLWSWGDGTTDIIPYPTHIYSVAGYYNICLSITDSMGCTHTYCDSSYLSKNTNSMVYINVIPPTEISDVQDEKLFNIFPNPASDYLYLTISQDIENADMKIFNVLGQIKKTAVVISKQSNINISDLASGTYIFEMSFQNKVVRQMFIKQ